jgi:hypothetical protein
LKIVESTDTVAAAENFETVRGPRRRRRGRRRRFVVPRPGTNLSRLVKNNVIMKFFCKHLVLCLKFCYLLRNYTLLRPQARDKVFFCLWHSHFNLLQVLFEAQVFFLVSEGEHFDTAGPILFYK